MRRCLVEELTPAVLNGVNMETIYLHLMLEGISINQQWGHTLRSSLPQIPYDAAPGSHTSRVSMQTPCLY